MTTRRRFLIAAAGAALAAPALAQGRLQWRMVTSWPRDLPGPGVSARRIAERIRALTDGRLDVVVHAAGEIVPGLGVFDAVAAGTAQMGHSAAFFQASKVPAAQAFTTLPFGFVPIEHHAWLDHGGGQALWDEAYAPFGVKALPGGNTGPSMGGWFTREIATPDDLRGLRIRVAGLGADLYRRLGAAPVLTAPGEIFAALRGGVIDAVEFLGPWSDLAQGFHQAARRYYAPGVTKPNGSSELLIGLPSWNALAPELRAAVVHGSAVESLVGLAEAEAMNARALATLREQHGVAPTMLPEVVLQAMRRAGREVAAALAERDPLARRVIAGYAEFLERARPWSAVGLGGFLAARNS
jgi:TRAP-type mannitol/chloroaromatic compound transport system substrate-binding protein